MFKINSFHYITGLQERLASQLELCGFFIPHTNHHQKRYLLAYGIYYTGTG